MRGLIAVSADGLTSPKLVVHPNRDHLQPTPFGWGIAWYPQDQQAGVVHKEPVVREGLVTTEDIAECSKLRSSLIMAKIKGGALGNAHHEIQPFSKHFAGREWLFSHNGDLDKTGLQDLLKGSRRLEPIGRTDSELAFCLLLSRIEQTDARSLRDLDAPTLHSWFQGLDHLGGADIVITDGDTMAVYYGKNSNEELHHARISPPTEQDSISSERFTLTFDDPRDDSRTKFVICSESLGPGSWTKMEPGQLIVVCQGSIIFNSLDSPSAEPPPPVQQKQAEQFLPPSYVHSQMEQCQSIRMVTNAKSQIFAPEGTILHCRTYEITHTTEYTYDEPVEYSTHCFRLQPLENTLQSVEYSAMTISSPGEQVQFEDVFGNQTLHYTINQPYIGLRVENQCRIRIFALPADDLSLSKRQTSIPIVWMPWQRQMMTPYLLPPELPDTQLEELTSYAMSFVERNDYHLIDTLRDMNMTIYQDYVYSQGNTSLDTTPFDVYTSRVGVCQDFANIFICMARLLGIPARYQMGYIHTGASYENKIQSEASHAWVELYLPYIGWRGYDPTNGCLVGQDHICVARGRNYRDATPTSGTLFKGGAGEKLSVTVKVQEV